MSLYINSKVIQETCPKSENTHKEIYLWRDKLPAIDLFRLLQHHLSPLQQILLLQCKSEQKEYQENFEDDNGHSDCGVQYR